MGSISLQSEKHLRSYSNWQKALLYCGIVSSLWYVIINIIVTNQYDGYNTSSQTVSELSAINTQTRTLWVALCSTYTLLFILFGWGIWLFANENKKLRFVAVVVIADAVFGAFWPPMHQREVIASGGGNLTDSLHLAWTYIHLVMVLLMIFFGAAALGKEFRIYSIATVIVFIVFGILTSRESPSIKTGEPTPYIGIWERINMAAYMIWIIVFAIALLQRKSNEHPSDK